MCFRRVILLPEHCFRPLGLSCVILTQYYPSILNRMISGFPWYISCYTTGLRKLTRGDSEKRQLQRNLSICIYLSIYLPVYIYIYIYIYTYIDILRWRYYIFYSVLLFYQPTFEGVFVLYIFFIYLAVPCQMLSQFQGGSLSNQMMLITIFLILISSRRSPETS